MMDIQEKAERLFKQHQLADSNSARPKSFTLSITSERSYTDMSPDRNEPEKRHINLTNDKNLITKYMNVDFATLANEYNMSEEDLLQYIQFCELDLRMAVAFTLPIKLPVYYEPGDDRREIFAVMHKEVLTRRAILETNSRQIGTHGYSVLTNMFLSHCDPIDMIAKGDVKSMTKGAIILSENNIEVMMSMARRLAGTDTPNPLICESLGDIHKVLALYRSGIDAILIGSKLIANTLKRDELLDYIMKVDKQALLGKLTERRYIYP